MSDKPAPWIAPGRALPLLLVFTFIASGVVLVEFGFRLSDRRWPGWLPHARVGAGFHGAIESKVAAAEYRLARLPPGDDQPLVVLAGQSTLRSGISASVLQAEDDMECRYLIAGGAGGGLLHFLKTLEPLRRTSLKPDLVVLGLHYFYLLPDTSGVFFPGVQGPPAEQQSANSPLGRLTRGISNLIRSHSWLAERRGDFTTEFNWRFVDTRFQLAQFLGMPLPGEPIENIDPWADYFYDTTREVPDRKAKMEEGAVQLTGKPEIYGRNEELMGSLIESIGRLRARGSLVALLIEPENSILRAATPPEAHEALVAPIEKAFPDSGVEIIDLIDLLPDTAFHDANHYNAVGREMLSRELARRIKGLLTEHGRMAE